MSSTKKARRVRKRGRKSSAQVVFAGGPSRARRKLRRLKERAKSSG